MRGYKGFSLVELMVTLAIASIATMVAIPSFSTFMQNNRMTTNTNDFITSLNIARSEAVKRGSKVTLCKSANGIDCTADDHWEQGWIIFVDSNDNAAVDAGEPLLLVHQALNDHTTLVGNTNVANYISYAAAGFTQVAGGGFHQTGTLILCDNRGFGEQAKAIVINFTGRPAAMKATDSNETNCSAT